jgi:DNA-directed RNA polymerase specialized sigma24 family protein
VTSLRATLEARRGAPSHDTPTQPQFRNAAATACGKSTRLTERCRARFAVGAYAHQEIAAKLGVTYTNVNRHVTEGRAELRELREAA